MIYAPEMNKTIKARPASGKHMACWHGTFVVGFILMELKPKWPLAQANSIIFSIKKKQNTKTQEHMKQTSYPTLKLPSFENLITLSEVPWCEEDQPCLPKLAGNWKHYFYTWFLWDPVKVPCFSYHPLPPKGLSADLWCIWGRHIY